MQGEYNACLAARVRIQREEICKAESKNHKHRLELKAEAKILRQEEKDYEREQRSLEKRHSQEHVERHSMASRDMDMERTEHYREWLSSQNYLDSLREADIHKTGRTNIPSRTKRADYSGMPKHWRSAKVKKRQVEQRNAMPGNSCQKSGKDKDPSKDQPKEKKDDPPKKSSPPRNKQGGETMGDDPSEPSRSKNSASDSTFSTTTETSTETDSSDSSEGETPENNPDRSNRLRRASSRRSTGRNERYRNNR